MAATTGDIYARLLGVTETNRPLNHYQLLRLKQFEDDPGQIRLHYNKLAANLRRYLSTEHAEKVQPILNELTRAMLCLTDNRRKSEYDATLGRTGGGETKQRSFEEILVGRKVISPEQLKKAQAMATAINVELREALLQQKEIKPDTILMAYAESIGLPYFDLAEVKFLPELLGQMPAMLARQHSMVPVMIDNDRLLVASPNQLPHDVEDDLRLRFGMAVRPVICAPAALHEAVNKFYPREMAAKEIGVTQSARQSLEEDEDFDPAEFMKKRQKTAGLGAVFTAGTFAILAGNGVVPGLNPNSDLMLIYGIACVLGIVAAGVGWFAVKK
jgi:hypothetical protein